jgi:hypothetical protein
MKEKASMNDIIPIRKRIGDMIKIVIIGAHSNINVVGSRIRETKARIYPTKLADVRGDLFRIFLAHGYQAYRRDIHECHTDGMLVHWNGLVTQGNANIQIHDIPEIAQTI